MSTKYFNAACKFGKQLIESQDLDPVYSAIHGIGLGWEQRARLVLAYSCLYHLGAAAYLSEFKTSDFWCYLRAAANNHSSPLGGDGRWPRGTERRHWRGQNAINTVEYLSAIFKTPEACVSYWLQPGYFEAVSNRIKETPSFGPWIAFKLVDLAERVMEQEINLNGCELGIYDEPRRGAALLITGDQDERVYPRAIQKLIEQMLRRFKGVWAPPNSSRQVNIMEMETVLCKYKAMVNGHYYVGKDIHELRHALYNTAWGKTAKKLLVACPPEVHYAR